jgi:hypothetical protein
MPASLVDNKFKAGKLHSGSKHGPLVTNPKQAKAIQLSEARDEGYDIPEPPKRGKRPKRKSTRGGNDSA